MKRVLLKLAYDGTYYHGWQVQPNGITVQQTMQNALEEMLSVRPGLTGCSRTDAGVHAKEFYCHFDCQTSIPTKAFVPGLNRILPQDISVFDAVEVPPNFHARYNAKGKTYTYVIDNAAVPDPFLRRYALYIKRHIDESKMNNFCKSLIGTHDFAAFSSIHRSVENTVRTVSDCHTCRNGNIITLTITADGFLYNMVRIIVGTALDAANGKISSDNIEKIFVSGRNAAGNTAPAHGLFLEKVLY